MSTSRLASLPTAAWTRVFNFRPDPRTIDAIWGHVETIGIMTAPIRLLRASLRRGSGYKRTRIHDAPHYAYMRSLVQGNGNGGLRKAYAEYVKDYLPQANAEEACRRLERMVRTRVAAPADASPVIVTAPPKRRLGILPYRIKIIDGVHRACLEAAMGVEWIECRVHIRNLSASADR